MLPHDNPYHPQVVLVMDVLPLVAAERCFALEGGTANASVGPVVFIGCRSMTESERLSMTSVSTRRLPITSGSRLSEFMLTLSATGPE